MRWWLESICTVLDTTKCSVNISYSYYCTIKSTILALGSASSSPAPPIAILPSCQSHIPYASSIADCIQLPNTLCPISEFLCLLFLWQRISFPCSLFTWLDAYPSFETEFICYPLVKVYPPLPQQRNSLSPLSSLVSCVHFHCCTSHTALYLIVYTATPIINCLTLPLFL